MATKPTIPARIGWPDCAGVLRAEQNGDGDHLEYTCQVGHRFSGQSLIEAKEDELEWTL